MPKKFPLQALLDLMRERTDEVTRKLGQLITAEQSARGRLKLLMDYRQEYTDAFRAAQHEGLTLQRWQNYQEFLTQIDEAIRQQTGLVENAVKNTVTGRDNWQKQNTRLKAIDTLSARHTRAEEKKENKQEQKNLDEFVNRAFHPAVHAVSPEESK